MKKGLINVYSLGCSKNLTDSERLMRRLEAKGYEVEFESPEPEGEMVMVNTCGFILDAQQESIDTILELSQAKEEGRIGSISVMGCLSERFMNDLKESLPEVDRWYGKFDWNAFIDELPDLSETEKVKDWERSLTTPEGSAYLKISEGCNRFCAFCAIPLITGRHKSRPIEEILEEVRALTDEGVREFNVIAQDLSSYGLDLYGHHALAELVDRMADIEGVEWIRLHYAYPSDFPMDLLDVMERRDNVCKYIDIALQHISDKVLSNMRRHITKQETLDLIAEMRRRVPGLQIRTTLMVGFPGEGEEEFEELMEFVRDARFERMGAFAYSEEAGTWGEQNLDDNIPQEVKQERLDRLMALQQKISDAHNRSMIGKEVKVLVEEFTEDGRYAGRTQWDSPDVDCQVIFDSEEPVEPGEFVRVKITDSDEFDLFGTII
ncbi:MAG: 30S ribosomal protein S12 methylthiotransferase RimO [Bacteroides sp.]|nr:30S ribosomal protein S12 methylthiotransferase RimO [Bacteroides sp.]